MQFRMVSQPADQVELPGDLASVVVPLTDINWSREVALLVDMGEQHTAGHSVKVLGIDLVEAKEVHLRLEVVRPRPGAFVAQVVTHPYAVARLPRVGLNSEAVLVVAFDRAGHEVGRQVVQL